MTFKFVDKIGDFDEDDLVYNPPERRFDYYQIAGFRNEKTNMYEIRKLTYDQYGNLLGKHNFHMDKSKLKKKLKTLPYASFQLYPYKCVNLIEYPKPEAVTFAMMRD